MTAAKARQGRSGESSNFPSFAKGAKDGVPEVWWLVEENDPTLAAMKLRRRWGTRFCAS